MLIVLNGVPNSGKTSVAKVLQSKIPNTVHLQVDLLRNMYAWMPIEDAVPVALENTRSLLPSFFKRKMNVILDYPLDPYWHSYITNEIPKDIPIYTFTLKPKLEKVITNRGSREIDSFLVDRIKYLYETDMNSQSMGTFIDNSNLTAEETAKIVLKELVE